MADRNTIAQELTEEQLGEFMADLLKLPGKKAKLAEIQAAAAARGITISLMSARSFRETTFKRALDRLSKARDLATQVTQMQTAGTGATLADASAAILSQQVFDLLDLAGDGELDLKKAGQIAFILSKIRQGDVASGALNVRIRTLELAQLDAAKVVLQQTRELKTIADDKTIDEEEKIARIRRRLFGEDPTTPTPTAGESGE